MGRNSIEPTKSRILNRNTAKSDSAHCFPSRQLARRLHFRVKVRLGALLSKSLLQCSLDAITPPSQASKSKLSAGRATIGILLHSVSNGGKPLFSSGLGRFKSSIIIPRSTLSSSKQSVKDQNFSLGESDDQNTFAFCIEWRRTSSSVQRS